MQNPAQQESSISGHERLNAALRQGKQALARVSVRRWQQLVALLVIVWLAHSLAQLFWLLTPAPSIPPAHISQNALDNGSAGAPQQRVDIAALRKLSVFGGAAAAPVGEDASASAPSVSDLGPQIEDQAVTTKLSLVLRGIISSNNDKAARAIIADAEQQDIYGPGDEINNYRDVKVAKVLRQRVILDNKGQYESLWLYDPNAPGLADSSSAPSADTGEANRRTAARNKRASSSGSAAIRRRNTHSERPQGPAVSVDNVKQHLSDVVAFNIYRENGKIKGYKVRPGRNPKAFNAAGLEAGDVVTAVNGTALDNPGKVMQIYRNLGQATSASLDIERDGKHVTVDIQLK